MNASPRTRPRIRDSAILSVGTSRLFCARLARAQVRALFAARVNSCPSRKPWLSSWEYLGCRDYNIAMPAAGSKRQPEKTSSEHHRTPQVYTLEATGLIVIAVLILILTLVRYWHNISWSAR